jgi:hypothetical protein
MVVIWIEYIDLYVNAKYNHNIFMLNDKHVGLQVLQHILSACTNSGLEPKIKKILK